MNIAKLCRRNVVTVKPSDELTSAAEKMREQHIGYLVVVEPVLEGSSYRPIGVLTDRDIVIAVVARGIDPRSLKVGDVMTHKPTVVAVTAALEEALQHMRRLGVRRLPVVDARGQLVGVLSLDEVIDALTGELQDVAASIRNEQRIESALRP
jgi:CBS domain-containing protein